MLGHQALCKKRNYSQPLAIWHGSDPAGSDPSIRLKNIYNIRAKTIRPYRLTVRTAGSHPVNRGSIPRRVTKEGSAGTNSLITLKPGAKMVFENPG